ncbi:MAG: hypothetical protein ACPIE8_08775, partial [Henriciella sp.]
TFARHRPSSCLDRMARTSRPMQKISYRVEFLERSDDPDSIRAEYFAHDRNAAVRAARALSEFKQSIDIFVIRAEIDVGKADFIDTGHVVFESGRLKSTHAIYR